MQSCPSMIYVVLFFLTHSAPTEIYTLSLHDALPILIHPDMATLLAVLTTDAVSEPGTLRPFWKRSEEHTSELQSHHDLVCRLLLEKKNSKLQPSKLHPLTAEFRRSERSR